MQDTDAFGDTEVKASKSAHIGRRIQHTVCSGAPQHSVDCAFDTGRSLGDDAKNLVRSVRELQRRIGVKTTARPARLATLRYQCIKKSFDRTGVVRSP